MAEKRDKRRLLEPLARGTMVVLPVLISGVLLYWTLAYAERAAAVLFQWAFPEEWWYPGFGILAVLLIIYAVGVILGAGRARRGVSWIEHLLERIPWLNTLYGATQDIVHFFAAERTRKFHQVVLVRLPGNDIELIGFMTRDHVEWLTGNGGEDKVGVYLPMSYQIGGYWVILPRNAVRPLDISVEEATRLVLTAGMSGHRRETAGKEPRP